MNHEINRFVGERGPPAADLFYTRHGGASHHLEEKAPLLTRLLALDSASRLQTEAHLGKVTDVALSKTATKELVASAGGILLIFPCNRGCSNKALLSKLVSWKLFLPIVRLPVGLGTERNVTELQTLGYREVCTFALVKETGLWPNVSSVDGCHSPVNEQAHRNPI